MQQFPIGTLKIDQSFVRDAAINSDDATIVRTIIDMGKALEVEVVAEGVETEEQFNFLRNRGCHYGQGRLFGDAMTADEFLSLVLTQEQRPDQSQRAVRVVGRLPTRAGSGGLARTGRPRYDTRPLAAA